ncbi:hypothetical protein J6590_064858 [Homalodisca vitripennis]|nr:hypothetical protein J6590_064858 [Homalodisca vitripennis]
MHNKYCAGWFYRKVIQTITFQQESSMVESNVKKHQMSADGFYKQLLFYLSSPTRPDQEPGLLAAHSSNVKTCGFLYQLDCLMGTSIRQHCVSAEKTNFPYPVFITVCLHTV